jgi:hypothetical protein
MMVSKRTITLGNVLSFSKCFSETIKLSMGKVTIAHNELKDLNNYLKELKHESA